MGNTLELTSTVRNEIITKYNLGIYVTNITNEYNIPRQTVYYQINKLKKKTKSVINLCRIQL